MTRILFLCLLSFYSLYKFQRDDDDAWKGWGYINDIHDCAWFGDHGYIGTMGALVNAVGMDANRVGSLRIGN